MAATTTAEPLSLRSPLQSLGVAHPQLLELARDGEAAIQIAANFMRGSNTSKLAVILS